LGERLPYCRALSRWRIDIFRGGMSAVERRPTVCERRSTRSRHTPRRRGIQYAAAFRFHHQRLWNTGSSAFADDDGYRHASALPRQEAPELCKKLPPKEGAARPLNKGAGNAGCPLHPRPVCKSRKHTVVTTVAPGSPGIPAREWF
jgi:hypothetical protein